MNSNEPNSETANPFAGPHESTGGFVTDQGEENPYHSPRVQSDAIPYRRRRLIVAVVLGILTVPAAVLVFFVTCFASAILIMSLSNQVPEYIIPLLVGAACAISTLFMMGKLIRRTLQKQPTSQR